MCGSSIAPTITNIPLVWSSAKKGLKGINSQTLFLGTWNPVFHIRNDWLFGYLLPLVDFPFKVVELFDG